MNPEDATAALLAHGYALVSVTKVNARRYTVTVQKGDGAPQIIAVGRSEAIALERAVSAIGAPAPESPADAADDRASLLRDQVSALRALVSKAEADLAEVQGLLKDAEQALREATKKPLKKRKG